MIMINSKKVISGIIGVSTMCLLLVLSIAQVQADVTHESESADTSIPVRKEMTIKDWFVDDAEYYVCKGVVRTYYEHKCRVVVNILGTTRPAPYYKLEDYVSAKSGHKIHINSIDVTNDEYERLVVGFQYTKADLKHKVNLDSIDFVLPQGIDINTYAESDSTLFTIIALLLCAIVTFLAMYAVTPKEDPMPVRPSAVEPPPLRDLHRNARNDVQEPSSISNIRDARADDSTNSTKNAGTVSKVDASNSASSVKTVTGKRKIILD